jgi:hypothetical protein
MRGSIGSRSSALIPVERRALALAPSWPSAPGMSPFSFFRLPRAFPCLTPGVCAGAVGDVSGLPVLTFKGLERCGKLNMVSSFSLRPVELPASASGGVR